MADYPWRDKDSLKELYVGEKMSLSEIAGEWDTDTKTIWRWMKRHDIPRRDSSTSTSLSQLPKAAYETLSDSEWLEREYWQEERSLSDIGTEVGVSAETVKQWMEKHGIERRGAHGRSGEHHPGWLGEELEAECAICATEFRKHTKSDVGKFCSNACKGKWRERNTTGEDNPAWNGGYDGYYGPNWRKQRRRARERDNYTCQRCGLTDEENEEEYGRELSVHHISHKKNFDDYQKMNALSNLITLCHQCHNLLEGLPIDNR